MLWRAGQLQRSVMRAMWHAGNDERDGRGEERRMAHVLLDRVKDYVSSNGIAGWQRR